MNVLLTHDRFPPDFGGGGEYVVLSTARALRARGIGVRVLTTGDPSMPAPDGIPVVRLPIRRHLMNAAVREVVRQARDADLIQTFTYNACLPSLAAGRILRKPVVCEVMALFGDLWREICPPPAGRLRQVWERFLITRRFSKLIFVSEFSRDRGLALGVRADRSVVIPPGIDLERYAPAPAKDDVVLFSGKLDARKGIDDVLAVARELPDVPFRVMGWGEREAVLKRASPANVEWPRYEGGASLAEAFGRARIFFFPSRGETFGLVIAEAMASGCAIVSSVPLEFDGLRVPAGDRRAMAGAVRRLWDDRARCREMGRRNVELARTYQWTRHVDRLVALYKDILTTPRPVGAPARGGHKWLSEG